MDSWIITAEKMEKFAQHLYQEERGHATVEKYLREVRQFSAWISEEPVTKEQVAAWKKYLLSEHYNPATVNGKLAALNSFFHFMGWQECRVKNLKLERKLFRDVGRELTREEYLRLIGTAEQMGKRRLSLLVETICATGIRVSEVHYITKWKRLIRGGQRYF